MADTLTTYLRLRLNDALTPASRYNLLKIDDAFSRLTVALDGDTTLRSTSDILILPESPDIGGSGVGGTVSVGMSSHSLTAFTVYAPVSLVGDVAVTGGLTTTSAISSDASLGMKDLAPAAHYLRLRYNSTLSGSADTADRFLTLDPQGANRNVVLGGDISLGGALTTASTLTTGGAFVAASTVSFGAAVSTVGAFSTGGAFSTASTFSAAAAVSLGAAVTTVGTVSLGGALTTPAAVTIAGAGTSTLTLALSGPTSLTLPTSGLVATTSGAALSPSRAVATDASGFLTSSSTTAAELGYVAGLTSSAQTQIDTKASRSLSNLTVSGLTLGDLLYATSSTTLARIPIGTVGQVLTAAASPYWADATGGGGGAATGITQVTYVDLVATSLPTGTAYSPDGVAVVDGDLVLFTLLSSGNNAAYIVTGVGVSLAWTAAPVFNGLTVPTAGAQVTAKYGTALGGGVAIGQFDGTQWNFNRTMRHFEGANYWEESGLYVTTLADGTTGNVFTATPTGSENWVIHFSTTRGANKDIGTLHLTTDGAVAAVAQSGAELTGATGVTFSADISGGSLRLRATTTSTGTAVTMRWHHERWSDSAGGPASVPSYSVSAATVPAAGTAGSIQIRGSSGFLAADTDLSYDTTEDAVVQGAFYTQKSASATLADNQASPADILTIPATWTYVWIDYGIARGTERAVGRLVMTNDGTTTFVDDDALVSSPAVGITFSASLSAGSMHLRYVSTNSGSAATMSLRITKWT